MQALIKDFYTLTKEPHAENRNGTVLEVVNEEGEDLGTYFMSWDGEYLEPKMGSPRPSSDILKGFEHDDDLKRAVKEAIPLRMSKDGTYPVIYAESLRDAAWKSTPGELRNLISQCPEHDRERACTRALFMAANYGREGAMDELLPYSHPSHFTERERELLYHPSNLERTEYMNHVFSKMQGEWVGVQNPQAQKQPDAWTPSLVATNVFPEALDGKFGLTIDAQSQDPMGEVAQGKGAKLWMSLDLKELKNADGTALTTEDYKALGYRNSSEFIERAKDMMDGLKGQALNRAAELGRADTVRYLQEHHVSPEESTKALMHAANSPISTKEAMNELAKHANLALFEEQYGEDVKSLPLRKGFELERAIGSAKEAKEIALEQQKAVEVSKTKPTQAKAEDSTPKDPSIINVKSLKAEELPGALMKAVESGNHDLIGQLKPRVQNECEPSVGEAAFLRAAQLQDRNSIKHLYTMSGPDVGHSEGWKEVSSDTMGFVKYLTNPRRFDSHDGRHGRSEATGIDSSTQPPRRGGWSR